MSSFQIKIVGDFCNLRCSYCRNRDFDQNKKTVMTIEILEKVFCLLESLPQKLIRVNWHGGEPLLAGRDFFNQILLLEHKHSDKIWINSVQTNATLVDENWAKYFHNNHFNIGVSVDGDEQTHDLDRIDAHGVGTYKRVMCGVESLRQHHINPNIICTVTKKSVLKARAILISLVNAGFREIAFNAFYNTASVRREDVYGLNDREWLLFLIEIFETWLSINNPNVHVREIDGILAWVKSKSMNSCTYKGMCHQWFAIDHLGNIYPCERFGKNICFGNVDSLNSFQELLNKQIFKDWVNEGVLLPSKCLSCNLFHLCHNGCRSHRDIENGDSVPIYAYCESRIGFYDFIKKKLTEERR